MEEILNKKPKLLGKIRRESWGGVFWRHSVARIDILNNVAFDVLEECNGNNTVRKIIDRITDEYEVPEEIAQKDVMDYLIKSEAVGYITGIDSEAEGMKEIASTFGITTPEEYGRVMGQEGIVGIGSNTLTAPMKVLIEFTKNCNLRCVHCFAGAECKITEEGFLEGELTKEQWFKVIDNIRDSRVFDIFVSGGEALIRKDIFEIMEYIKNQGLGFCLLTNATLITDEIARKLKVLGCYKVEANLDGYDEKTYDYFRGCKGSFRDTVEGIKACLRNGLPIRCNVTITKLNIGCLKEIADTAYEIGVREICCVPLEQGGRADENWERLHITQEDNALFHYEEVEKYTREKYGESMLFVVPLERHVATKFGKSHKFAEFWDPNGLLPSCGAGKYHCSVNPYGEVILCPTAGDYIKFEPNGLLKHSLSEIWTNAQTFIDIRNSTPKQCVGCEHIECDRGCPLTMYRKYGKLNVPIGEECVNI